MSRPFRKLAVLALLGATSACVTGRNPREELDLTIHELNSDLRWQKYGEVATRLAPETQKPFFAQVDGVDKNLEIDDFEIQRTEHQTGSSTAVAHVEISWDRKNEAVLHTSDLLERWERRGQRWVLARVDQGSGDPFPWLPAGGSLAPASAPASGPDGGIR